MRIEQLRHARAIADAGSFRRAAEALHLTQPALSQSVRSLERQLGVEILSRGARNGRVTWSEAGRELLPHFLNIISADESLRFELSELGSLHKGAVRMGVVNAAAGTVLPGLIKTFHEQYSQVQLMITETSSSAVRAGVAADEFDVGVLVNHVGEIFPSTLNSTVLLRSDVAVFLSSDHEWRGRHSMCVEDLWDIPLIVHNPGFFMRDMIDGEIPADHQNVLYTTNNSASLLVLVQHNVGITVLPRISASVGDSSGVTQVPLLRGGEPMEVELSVLTRDSRLQPRSIDAVVDLLRIEARCL